MSNNWVQLSRKTYPIKTKNTHQITWKLWVLPSQVRIYNTYIFERAGKMEVETAGTPVGHVVEQREQSASKVLCALRARVARSEGGCGAATVVRSATRVRCAARRPRSAPLWTSRPREHTMNPSWTHTYILKFNTVYWRNNSESIIEFWISRDRIHQKYSN